MKKTVNEKQIERLFQFTREHYVKHYDLQSELVDHLANAIEQRWEETPKNIAKEIPKISVGTSCGFFSTA